MEEVGGIVIGAILIWWFLEIIGNWKLFKKAGKPGWHSIIPILNIYDEFAICWKGSRGLLLIFAMVVANSITQEATQDSDAMAALAGISAVVIILLHLIESRKLAKAFGKGLGYTLFLIIFDRLGRIVLGFGSAQYIGKR